MLVPLGREAGANKRQVAAKLFERASEEETEADTEMYKILLANGTETLPRFQAEKVPWLDDSHWKRAVTFLYQRLFMSDMNLRFGQC